MDASGNLYVADQGNNTIREIVPTGTNWVVSTIAGISPDNGGPNNGGSNDGTNSAAEFNAPSGICVDSSGNLYVADTYNYNIRKIVPVGTNWVVSTIAGTAPSRGGGSGSANGTNGAAQFSQPYGIAVDGSGNLYVSDQGNSIIRQIVPMGTNWVVSTIAGTAPDKGGSQGFVDGTNGAAQFAAPGGIAVGAGGNLYVADAGNSAIRRVTLVGTNWVTVTLGGAPGSVGSTDGTGPDASFTVPYDIAVDNVGNVFVSDEGTSVIREGSVATTGGVSNLTISLIGLNSVVVSWTGSGTLQTNSNLSTSNWVNYGGEVNSSGGVNSVTVTPLSGNLFFRLTN